MYKVQCLILLLLCIHVCITDFFRYKNYFCIELLVILSRHSLFFQAEENGLLFMPIAGKTQEAKQVYRYGKVQIYLDRNVIFVFENQIWIPVSLQNLIMKAKP